MSSRTSKVAYNSIALYTNMIVTMAVTLLGTRFVLKALGNEDYAIYALIANIVALFSFLNIAMAGATQRFLSFSLGENDNKKLKEIFYNSSLIHYGIAAISTTMLLFIGIPAISFWLEIPMDAHIKAIFVLIFMAMGIIFIILSVPYEATMNAHEDISVIAGINILDACIKLISSVIILCIPYHRLPIYAALIMCSSLVAFICKRRFCRKKYEETHFCWHKVEDFSLTRKMIGYAGWNLIGTGCSIARFQGVAILLNNFFGLIYNAAYGVAQQINGFLMFFANSVIRPMRPHIIKSEGSGQHDKMIKYANTTSRFTTLMLAAAIIPLYLNMPYILQIWLEEIPTGTTEFCRGFLVITLIAQLSIGQQIALESVGKIKNQHLTVGIMHILPLPAAFILYKYSFPFYSIIYCIIIEEILCIFVRTYIAHRDADMPIYPFVIKHIIPSCICIVATFYLTMLLTDTISSPIIKLVTGIITSTLVLSLLSWLFCFEKWEKEKIYSLFKSILYKKL